VKRHEVAGFVLTETRYPASISVPRHSHEHGYICLVRQGGYIETYGKKTRACGPSTLAFHPPGEIHSEHFHNREALSFNIEISPRWLARVREYSGVLDCPTDFQGGPLARLALRLYKEFDRMDDVSPLAIEGLALEMMAEAARAGRVADRKPPRWLAQARDLLHARFNESLALKEIARSAGVHPVYLASAFRRFYGCTVGEYVRRLRVEYACREITTTDAALVDVAFAAGFASQSHLCNAFKSFTGLTPTEYRSMFCSS
jgi:AraC family transcriptional regulator